MKNAVLLLGLSTACVPLFAQEQSVKEESSRVTVQIIEEKGGDRIVEERSYDVGTLTPERQRVYLDSLLDAVSQSEKGSNRRVTITMEEGKLKNSGKGTDTFTEFHFPQDWKQFGDRATDIAGRDLDRLGGRIDAGVARGMARMESQMGRLLADAKVRPAEINADIQKSLSGLRVFVDEPGFFNASKTVRALTVQPNRPFDGSFNVKFSTKAKGDVAITVTDTKGKEQARKNLKDFEGEFVGQIELKHSGTGTYFVKVIQNEDGLVQRVVVP